MRKKHKPDDPIQSDQKAKIRLLIESLRQRYPLIGWISITFLLLSCFILMLFCSRGDIDISHYTIAKALKVSCGCKTVQDNYSVQLRSELKVTSDEKKLLSDSIKDIQSKIDQISMELQRTNNANELLITQRDSLEGIKIRLENRLLEKDSLIDALSKTTESMQTKDEDVPTDSSPQRHYQKRIDSLLLAHNYTKNRLSVLENVYISTISVRRVSDSHIIVSYTLIGLDTQKKYYPEENPRVFLKVFDEEKKSFIEMVEKNPQTGMSKHETASCLIKFSKESNNEYNDVCHFINTQDSPFNRGLFGLRPKKFTFLFYLPGYNRPLSYYPATIKRMKK